MSSNLWALLEPSFKRNKNHVAWICREKSGRREVTYQQLHDNIVKISRQLLNLGIQPQDTVGIYAANGPEWSAAALAIWRVGAIVAPIHIGNSDFEIASQIKAVCPKIIVTNGADLDHDNCMPISWEENFDGVDSSSSIPNFTDQSSDTAVRIYTSGSTGSPKIVKLSHGNHASNVLAASNIEYFSPKDRFISLLPFSHAMGLTANLLLPLYSGSTTVSPKVLAASEILATLEEEKISVVIAVPRLFRNIMIGLQKKIDSASPGLKIYIGILKNIPQSFKKHLNGPIRKKFGGNIKVWVSGGSHLDGQITRYYHGLGLPLRQGYGLTETAPLTCVQTAFDPEVESVGKPIENVTVKIHQADENGNGEVWIRGPNVMLGYENATQNEDAFEEDWFKSGDIGKLTQDGKLILTGRSKRLIVTEAGKNVYPEELETLLERNAVIKEAGVFENEMKPVCVLAMESISDIKAAQAVLKNYNSLVSAHNKITRFAIVEELPRTPLGKIALQALPKIFQESEVK